MPQPPQQFLPDHYSAAAHSYASAGGYPQPGGPPQGPAPAPAWGAAQGPPCGAAPGMLQEPVHAGPNAALPQEQDPDDDPNRLPTFVKVRGLPAEHDPRIARRPKAKKRTQGVCCA